MYQVTVQILGPLEAKFVVTLGDGARFGIAFFHVIYFGLKDTGDHVGFNETIARKPHAAVGQLARLGAEVAYEFVLATLGCVRQFSLNQCGVGVFSQRLVLFLRMFLVDLQG